MSTNQEEFGAVEVAAMLGDSVVSVKHCVDPRGGKVTRGTWALFATGIACLVGSALAFKSSVDTAAFNKGALAYHTHVRKLPAYAFRPTPIAPGLDFLAFGGLALGLFGVSAGLVRTRREQTSPYYRVGTAAGVEQPLETAPAADFPLIAPRGDAFVFNFGAGFAGEMMANGTTTPLSELVQAGRARPSLTTPGAIEVPITAGAKIRARSGNTTFMVAAVAKPKEQSLPVFAFNSRVASYFAGSLAVHVGLWAVLQGMPEAEGGIVMHLQDSEQTDLFAHVTDHDTTPPEENDALEPGLGGGTDPSGGEMRLDEGQAGDPKQTAIESHMRVKQNTVDPVLARARAIEEARTAGIMGSTAALTQGISSLTGDGSISSGFAQLDVYGAMEGNEGAGYGALGFGMHGNGLGGGCTQEPCGLVNAGRYGTIGNGRHVGDGWGGVPGGKGNFRRHLATGPKLGPPTATGGTLDKEIIRRYIKRRLAQIGYCYEKQLLVNPILSGTVKVDFLIAANGTVQTSRGSGLETVDACVASIVQTIKFPAPEDGGIVQVSYPFTFRPAGQ